MISHTIGIPSYMAIASPQGPLSNPNKKKMSIINLNIKFCQRDRMFGWPYEKQ